MASQPRRNPPFADRLRSWARKPGRPPLAEPGPLGELEARAAHAVAQLTGGRPVSPLVVRGAVAGLAVAVCVLLFLSLSRSTRKAAAPLAPRSGPGAGPRTPAPTPTPVRSALPEPPAAAADEGFLEITLTPGGTVSIDGKEATPVEGTQRFTLKVGPHEVMASDSKVITAWSVAVRPGATVKKQFTFHKHK